jgi:tellurite resistance protein
LLIYSEGLSMNDALYKLLDGACVNVEALIPSQSRQLTVEERDELLAALRAADQLTELREEVRTRATEETAGADDAG